MNTISDRQRPPTCHYLGDEPITGMLTPEQMRRINPGFYRTYARILARIAREGIVTEWTEDDNRERQRTEVPAGPGADGGDHPVAPPGCPCNAPTRGSQRSTEAAGGA